MLDRVELTDPARRGPRGRGSDVPMLADNGRIVPVGVIVGEALLVDLVYLYQHDGQTVAVGRL